MMNAGPVKVALDVATAPRDPLELFRIWYGDAERALDEASAMALATADSSGRPSVRMVLLKGVDPRGFVFYTHTTSRKGRELEANPWAALCWYWSPLGRQIRVEGRVAHVDATEADAYWASRPVGSRLSARVSPQSRVVESRSWLEARVREAAERFRHGSIPRPAAWTGYRLAPESIEFWQNGAHRLHDRLRYRHEAGLWLIERLAP
jgi:pyridoxamine 5'-phosphate oxidase